jgi:hypothetical protein
VNVIDDDYGTPRLALSQMSHDQPRIYRRLVAPPRMSQPCHWFRWQIRDDIHQRS